LADAVAETAMAGSLRRWGQLAPVVACVEGQQLQLLDGFKRQVAAAAVGLTTLSVRVVELDGRQAKAALLSLNSQQRPTRELEEAWIVQALVREDGLSQVEVGQLLGRHKSWVCRRLALLERLSDSVRQDMRLGLVGPTLARQLLRLPTGNQEAVLALTRQQALSAQEVRGVIDLLQGAGDEQTQFILHKPREALQRAQRVPLPLRDPRLSSPGNWLAAQLARLLEGLTRIENWLRSPGEGELRQRDRDLLRPQLVRVGEQSQAVAELVLGPALLGASRILPSSPDEVHP
jgi:ParB-like chromosome segregation protein Spo0J